ncbi:MAG: hypothetical protein R2932_23625 [Caldilineaceae bacterium]
MNDKPWFAHYEATVPQTITIPRIPLHQFLTDAAQKYPNNVAIRMVLKYLPLGLSIQSKLSYRELDEHCDRLRRRCSNWGLAKGIGWRLCCPIFHSR